MKTSYLTASARGGWAPETDDRWFADTERGLFYVADASGPTYGGYYAPFAVDPGLAHFLDYFDAHTVEPELRLLRATEHANAKMYQQQSGSGPALASLKEADDARPPQWKHLEGRSLAHYTASLTALYLTDNKYILAQVGSCRAYLRRRDDVRLILPDHSLPTVWAVFGRATVEEMEHHRTVVSRLLGYSESVPIDLCVGSLEPGDTFFLCSDGVWHGNATDEVLRAATSPNMTQEILSQVVEQYTKITRGDATAMIIKTSVTNQ